MWSLHKVCHLRTSSLLRVRALAAAVCYQHALGRSHTASATATCSRTEMAKLRQQNVVWNCVVSAVFKETACICFGLIHSFIHSFIHSVVCLTTDPQPLSKRVLHTVRCSASCFYFQCLRISLRSYSSCLILSSSFRHLYSSFYFSLNIVLQKTVPTQYTTNPISLPPLYCMYDIPLLLVSV